MRNSKIYKFTGLLFAASIFSFTLESCSQAGGNKTGHEYMQDMGHSIAYEANMINDFYYNRWDPKGYYALSQPRTPVSGTVPRGYVGLKQFPDGEASSSLNQALESETTNGYVPYYYKDTDEERTRAINEIIYNPYPITAANLARGKELYNIYCGICHGEKGDGLGYLVRDDGKYPAQPAILTSDEFVTSSNGRFYHAIMYGKNVMSGYSDKMSYKERWQVIQYIRSLQAAAKGVKYDATENGLNKTDFIASVSKTNTSNSNATSDETSSSETEATEQN